MKKILLVIMLILITVPAQAQTRLNIQVPDAQMVPCLSTQDCNSLEALNATFNYQDNSDAESRFKDARYMLQKNDMYVAYNKDNENLEIGLFACY